MGWEINKTVNSKVPIHYLSGDTDVELFTIEKLVKMPGWGFPAVKYWKNHKWN